MASTWNPIWTRFESCMAVLTMSEVRTSAYIFFLRSDPRCISASIDAFANIHSAQIDQLLELRPRAPPRLYPRKCFFPFSPSSSHSVLHLAPLSAAVLKTAGIASSRIRPPRLLSILDASCGAPRYGLTTVCHRLPTATECGTAACRTSSRTFTSNFCPGDSLYTDPAVPHLRLRHALNPAFKKP